ncbi:3-oxoacyl-ACP reductase [Planomonospora sphaerica]|uniref:3-oxoacyl-ACP reductase n=1 Tax=Planomonospora sphaerica TaxID=161355 RepID=A0A171CTA9_9ACTN|nr:3-oxoacyl-ACP reductase [Planomonospora sphaerica]
MGGTGLAAVLTACSGYGEPTADDAGSSSAAPSAAPSAAETGSETAAGIGRSADLVSLTEEGIDELFAVNVRAPFFIVQHGLERLRDGGRIINISSGAARLAMPEIIAYGSTKGALDTFTLNLAKQLGPRGITVNSVAPGIVDTDVNAGWLRGNAEAQARAASLAALGRMDSPRTSPTSSPSSPPTTPAG